MSGTDVSIWMPFYVGDHLKETGHLSAMEQGVYLLLQLQYWSTGKPLPDNNERLTRIARVSKKEWAEVRDVMAEFFVIADGVWCHRRLDEQLVKAHKNKARRTEIARNAAEARWHPDDAPSNASSNANGMPEAFFE